MTTTSYAWLHPNQCEPPHGITHPEHYEELRADIAEHGWRIGQPALIGYRAPWCPRVLLLSGSHRWKACRDLDALIPVVVLSHDAALSLWGRDEWRTVLDNGNNILDTQAGGPF